MGGTRREVLAGAFVAGAAARFGAIAQTARRDDQPVRGRVERLDPALDALIAPDAAIETLASGLVWCEGPTWVGAADGYFLYSDVKGNRIRRFRAGEGDGSWLEGAGYVGPLFPEVIQEPGTNGLYATRRHLLAADSGNRCVARFDYRSKARTVLHDRFEGRRFNSPNDLCVSPRDGAIYFTDPCYGLRGTVASPVRELDFTGVFRIARDDRLTLVGKFDVPNGIGISPDGRTLYHTDKSRGWLAHRLDDAGAIAATRVFIDPATTGLAGGDGLKIDARGNMWTTIRANGIGGVAIVTPAGRLLGRIATDGIVSNCAFGGDGHLYMTCNHQVARIPVRARALAAG